jgi:hypothetical protein
MVVMVLLQTIINSPELLETLTQLIDQAETEKSGNDVLFWKALAGRACDRTQGATVHDEIDLCQDLALRYGKGKFF